MSHINPFASRRLLGSDKLYITTLAKVDLRLFSINAPCGAFPTFWGGEARKLMFGSGDIEPLFRA
ncbi:hypothetical protein [Nostoc sp.]|uniref:hypothetical protein n=1 Tax=Nostoc sp. TaxID=1180 RepID=UPI002FF5B8E6